MHLTPVALQDSYKIAHHKCYKPGTTKIYSNLTPRSFKRSNSEFATLFGLQYFLKRYFVEEFNNWFKTEKSVAVGNYKRMVEAHLGGEFDTTHIEKLHDLQYLPLSLKALPEGLKVKQGIPVLTITNTLNEFYWLPNFLETLISNTLWYPSTVAINTNLLKTLMTKYANQTCDSNDFVDYQCHDFSLRGHHSNDSGVIYGSAWALSFKGSDSFPSMQWLEHYYNADINNTIKSVVATEHSIASSYGEDEELDYLKHMINNVSPNGIVSIVADTWSFPRFMTKLLPKLKEDILKRNGKFVVRPDSFWTNPQDCLCGYNGWHEKMSEMDSEERQMIKDGAIQTLYNMFGGYTNNKGYKELNPKIGVIYGEALFYERLEDICQRLIAKGFASNTFIAGIGSWTALKPNRDEQGWAMKATYCENTIKDHISGDNLVESINMFKDPITDDGIKKSLKGLIYVGEKDGEIYVEDQVSWEKEKTGLLTEVFVDGKIVKETSLEEIRTRLNNT